MFLILLKTGISEYLIEFQELIKLVMYLGIKLAHVNVDQMQMFVIINSVGIMINADVNVKNRLIKINVMMYFFGILAHVNVVNHIILMNI